MSYFYGFTIETISTMTIFQFSLYMHEIGNIMRIFNGQPPVKRPAEINQIAKQYGIIGPTK